MPNISASSSSAALTQKAKETAANTQNLAEYLELLRNEIYRLRIGDTDADDRQVT